MIKEWTDFIARCNVRPHVIFLVDYDMDLAEHLVHGVDLWLNTPRRPWEASGTSGMKVLVNGGLNLSELDGWWAEAYAPEVGWALGDGLEHGDDPAVDAAEADRLYDLLEYEIVPEFYDRDADGISRRWTARVRESMGRLTPQFSTNRMMRDYLVRYYLPGALAYRGRASGEGTRPLRAWRDALDAHWDDLTFVDYSVDGGKDAQGEHYDFQAKVSTGRVPLDTFHVEIYAEPGETHVLQRDGDDARGVFTYTVSIPARRPASEYTPRLVPWRPGVQIPLECSHILWYR
jgi:glycogen phosphorylase